jgi:hypothetical protein
MEAIAYRNLDRPTYMGTSLWNKRTVKFKWLMSKGWYVITP